MNITLVSYRCSPEQAADNVTTKAENALQVDCLTLGELRAGGAVTLRPIQGQSIRFCA